MGAMVGVLPVILRRCPELRDDWERARKNTYSLIQRDRRYRNTCGAFDGAAGIGGDWMLIAEEAIPKIEIVLAHELLHLNGHDHDETKPGSVDKFYAREAVCSGRLIV